MKIGVLSDTRVPTEGSGGHGLGRVAWDIADGFARRGHEVVLYGGPGSTAPDRVVLREHDDEEMRAGLLTKTLDVFIDLSHFHVLSRARPGWPVLNYLMDTECDWFPPRSVVVNTWQKRHFRDAKIVPLGVAVDKIPFGEKPTDELLFCAKFHPHKGADIALKIARDTERKVVFAGQLFGQMQPPHYAGVIESNEVLHEIIGHAAGLLAPSRRDAGGRVILEAAACGTPTLTLDWSGAQCHVAHCVSGFVCRDVAEMVDAVDDLPFIDREKCRAWSADTHDLRVMLDGLERLATAALDGEVW